MAAISSMLGDIPASEKYYSMVTNLDPSWSEAHYNLADIYLKQGKLDRAIMHYKKALEIMPDWTQAKEKLQMLRERKQKFQNAVQKLTNALQQNPNQPRLHSSLGTIYYQNANLDRAIHHWQIALKLNPNQPTVLNNLALVKLTHPNPASRNPRHALSMAKKACQLVDYEQPHFLGTLAAAYAATGNFNDAVKTAQNALNLAKQKNNQPLIIELTKRLQSYKKQKP